jgi:hypothetical protein
MDTRDQLWIQVHNTDEAGEDERFWDPEWPLYFRLGLEPEVEKGGMIEFLCSFVIDTQLKTQILIFGGPTLNHDLL